MEYIEYKSHLRGHCPEVYRLQIDKGYSQTRQIKAANIYQA